MLLTSRDRRPATSPTKTAPSSNPARNTLRAKDPVGSRCFPVPVSYTHLDVYKRQLETRPESNQVVVGASELLSISRITATDAVWLASDDDGSDATDLFVQLRAHGTPIPVASLTRDDDAGTISVILADSARGVARGQSMVVYRGSRVLGEGTIDATGR